MIDLYLTAPIRTLGQPPPGQQNAAGFDGVAWGQYLQALRAQTVGSWNDAVASYKTLIAVREKLGLKAFQVTGEAAPDPNALSDAEVEVWQEQAATVAVMTQFIDDAIAGTRPLAYDANGVLGIETSSKDNVSVANQNGWVVLVDKATGQPTHDKGTVGTPWMIILASVNPLVALLYYTTTESNNKTLQVQAQEKTQQTIAKTQREAIKAGANPDQVVKIGQSIPLAVADLRRAEAEKATAESAGGLSGTIKTVGLLALGIAGLVIFGPPLVRAIEGAVATRRPREPHDAEAVAA